MWMQGCERVEVLVRGLLEPLDVAQKDGAGIAVAGKGVSSDGGYEVRAQGRGDAAPDRESLSGNGSREAVALRHDDGGAGDRLSGEGGEQHLGVRAGRERDRGVRGCVG